MKSDWERMPEPDLRALVNRWADNLDLGAEHLVVEHENHFAVMFLAEAAVGDGNDWALQVNLAKLDLLRSVSGENVRFGQEAAKAAVEAWRRYAPEREEWRRAKHGATL
jgi:hypothetical protein